MHLLEVLVEMVFSAETVLPSSTAPSMRTVGVNGIVNCFDVSVEVSRTCKSRSLSRGLAARDQARV